MGSSVDWKKRFESGRLGAWEINVTGKSGVIVGVRLPAVGGIIFLAIEMKMDSQHWNLIVACHRIESSKAFVGLTFYRSYDLQNSVHVLKCHMPAVSRS